MINKLKVTLKEMIIRVCILNFLVIILRGFILLLIVTIIGQMLHYMLKLNIGKIQQNYVIKNGAIFLKKLFQKLKKI